MPRSARLTAVGNRQTEVIAQGRALVILAVEAAPLQQRDDLFDEELEFVVEIGRHDVEAVARIVVQPELHMADDLPRRADNRTVRATCGAKNTEAAHPKPLPTAAFHQ